MSSTESPSGRAERWLPLAGVVFVLLAVAAVVLLGDAPSGWSSDDAIRSYYADHANRIRDLVAALIVPVAGVAYLVHTGTLASRLRRADPEGAAPAVVLAGGAVFVALFSAGIVSQSMVGSSLEFSDHYRLDLGTARTFGDLAFWLVACAAMGASVSVAATCLAARRTGALSRRLAWPGAILAVLLLGVAPLWGVPIALYGLWIVATSLLLLRRRPETARAARAALAAG